MGVKPKWAPFVKNWTPNPYSPKGYSDKNDFFQILTFYIYTPFDSKFNAEKKT